MNGWQRGWTMDTMSGAGTLLWLTVTAIEVLPSQPLAEVTVTVYVPDVVKLLVAEAVLAPPLQA
jgi:hypothetical protein